MSQENRWQAEKHPRDGMRKHKGFSLIELLIVVAIILIIAAIAIPNLLRSKMAANESSAASMTRTLYTAGVTYSSTWSNGFPTNIGNLAPAAVATCDKADLIDAVLASGTKSGYNYSFNQDTAVAVKGAGCAAAGSVQFSAGGSPIKVDVSGKRTFCASADGVIHVAGAGGAVPATAAACQAHPSLKTE